MKIILLIPFIVAMTAGCATTDQTARPLSTLTNYQLQYCATANPYQRAIAISVLQRLGTGLPDSGVCTDLAEAILDGRLPEVDVQQTEADREWARNMLGDDHAEDDT